MPTRKRPCTCDKSTCHVCYLYYTSARHRIAWGGPTEAPPLPVGVGTVEHPVAPKVQHSEPTKPKRVPLSCVHVGQHTGELVECPTCSGNVKVKVFECGIYKSCTPTKKVQGIECCESCSSYTPREVEPKSKVISPWPPRHKDMKPGRSVEWIKQLFKQPYGEWPRWVYGPDQAAEVVKQAFRELFHDVQPPPKPQWTQDKGIVICAGGWRFFPSLFVTVRMIRETGCDWPIQVWYLGNKNEFDLRMARILKAFDVGWIDADAMWRDRPGMSIYRSSIDHGWMLKPFAAAFSPYREVLSLDADSYPVRHPEVVLSHPDYQRTGAIFWPDFNPLEPGQYERFGLEVPNPRRGLETGQFVVDKDKNWESLWLTCWLNAYHDYVWGPGHRDLYGDKDTFLIAWGRNKAEFSLPCDAPQYDTHSYIQPAFDGQPLFVHRTRDKFRWHGEFDGKPVDRNYNTYQQAGDRPLFVRTLPGEYEAWKSFNACSLLMRPENYFPFRPDSTDRQIWNEVVYGGAYIIPYLKGVTVIDVGAHIGAFTSLAVANGSREVHAYEPNRDSHKLLLNVVGNMTDRIFVYNEGVWDKDAVLDLVSNPSEYIGHHAGWSTLRKGKVEMGGVKVVSFDKVFPRLERADKILVKLDCEGAEWKVMGDFAPWWDKVWMIVGEYHEMEGYTEKDLYQMLEAKGFKVEVLFKTRSDLGAFRAIRL